MPEDTKPSKLKWILIAVNGFLVLGVIIVFVFATRPEDHHIARKLQTRGYMVIYNWEYDDTSNEISIWQRPTHVAGNDVNLSPEDSRLICQLPCLYALDFAQGDVSGLNLDNIGNCQRLRYFRFFSVTGFPKGEIQKLATCPVAHIALVGVGLTDSNLEAFIKFSDLENLALNDNVGITDAGLEHLEKIPNLKELNLSKTSVTKEGIEEFQEKRPDVTVHIVW